MNKNKKHGPYKKAKSYFDFLCWLTGYVVLTNMFLNLIIKFS